MIGQNKKNKDFELPSETKPIDFSKIANLEASEKAGINVSDLGYNAPPLKTKKGSGKFSFTTAERIPLPSRGVPYDNIEDEDIRSGFIQVYPMTAKDEEILSTQKFIREGIATRIVLDNCIASSIPAKELTLFDSNYILFHLRSISYGDEYKFNLTCQNTYCQKEFEHEVKISELEFEELAEGFQEPFMVSLPVSKYKVFLRLPRLVDSETISNNSRNKKKKSDDIDEDLIDGLIVTTIKIVDPEGVDVEKRDWREFFTSLIGKDIAEIRKQRNMSSEFDKIPVGCTCPYCQTEYKGRIPITAEFFRF